MDEDTTLREGHETGSGRPYVLALVALLVLTAITFGFHYAPFGGTLGLLVAMVVATIKVGIVAMVFMELRESFPATRTVAAVGVAWVVLICLGIAGDVALR